MNAFVVVAFHDAAMLHRGIGTLEKLQTEGKVKLYASTAVARDSNGKLSVQETTKEGLGATAVGALIGGVAGLPLGPLAMTIGAAAGATIGMSADLLNEGDEGKFAEKVSRELGPGKAVIVAEVDQGDLTAFKAMMEAIGGTVMRK